MEALESEFLESLHETRELEADLSAALRPLLDPQVLMAGWTLHPAVLRILDGWTRLPVVVVCRPADCMYALAVLRTPQQGAWCLHCRPPASQARQDSAACGRTSPEPPASRGACDAGWTPSAPLLPACGTVPRSDTRLHCCDWCSLKSAAAHCSLLITLWICSLQCSSYQKQVCLKRLPALPHSKFAHSDLLLFHYLECKAHQHRSLVAGQHAAAGGAAGVPAARGPRRQGGRAGDGPPGAAAGGAAG